MSKYKAELIDDKMMLISSDIQVGEKYFTEDGTLCERYASEPTEGSYKVIGKISPDATWVKRGDEFDEYYEATFYMGISEAGWDREQPWEPIKEKKKFCMVKGPCGRFH